MKIAYLIDHDSLGGGMEYVRRQIAAHQSDECRVFFAECGECSPRQMDVMDLCVFAGAIPEAERYLKCAEVVVSPSRWEGMPYLMMKARALGRRILATDCPGNRDVLAGYDKWEKMEL